MSNVQIICNCPIIDGVKFYTHQNYFNPDFTFDRETFQDLNGFEGRYSISSFGRIKSLKGKGLILKQSELKRPRDYPHLTLYPDGKKKNFEVHRLVALNFVKNPSSKIYVNHKDKDRLNTSVFNLEWVTKEENTKHSVNFKGGVKKKRKVMKMHEANTIKYMLNMGEYNMREIAKIMGVGYYAVQEINKGKTWN